MFLDEPLVGVQHHHVFTRPRAAAEQNLALADPRAQLALLRLVAVRHVELEAASHLHRRRICSCVRQALRVEVALRIDFRKAAEHLAEEPPQRLVARRAAVGDAGVHEIDGHAALLECANEIGPDFRFGEDYGARVHGVERALHATAEVKRVVNQDIIRRHLALGRLPAGRGRRGEHEPHIRIPFAHRAHELPRHLHLAHAHGVNPYPTLREGRACRGLREGRACRGLFRENIKDFLRIASETVCEARAVPPAALHAQQEGRHHHQIGDGEQRVIQNPFHQFRNNCQTVFN